MLQRRWTGVVVLAGVLGGCANHQPAPAPPAAVQPVGTPLSLAAARDQLTRANPNAEVGSVVAVLPESNLAAVGDMPLADFRVGDAVTFLDGNLNSLTLGTVVRIQNGNLHVRYDAPPAGHRLPEVGDIAVRIPNGAPPTPQATASGDAAAPSAPATPAAPTDTPAAPTPTPTLAPGPTPEPAASPATTPATPPAPQPEMNK
jgi:hypothetical protein